MDDFTREGFRTQVDFLLPSEREIHSTESSNGCGRFEAICSVKGHEYSAVTFAWAVRRSIGVDFIQPDHPPIKRRRRALEKDGAL
jgi:hypothetical protein